MGGHSHWATTKRHKGVIDAKRGKTFTKIIREITVAARLGGGDPEGNPRLRFAVLKAKDANMPADNIKKAIQRGTGELPGVHFEEFQLEGYGPGGCALLIDLTSDNRNRTVAEIRNILTKQNANLAEAGAVSWQFHKKGLLVVEQDKADEEKLMTVALDAGAEDIRADGKIFEVISKPHDFENVKKAVADAKIATSLAEVTYIPENYIRLDEKTAEQALKLVDTLEDQDDVQKVHANFDIPEAIMEKVAAAG